MPTMIHGLGAQMVVRAVPADEAKHIARSYFTSELGIETKGSANQLFALSITGPVGGEPYA